jgi:hypothetical protein
MKYLDKVEMSNLLLSILWIIFFIPLYLSFSNAFATDEVKEECIDIPIIEEVPEIKGETIIPEEVEINEVELTDITIINDSGYIWEKENNFDNAFNTARSLLGPNKVFTWNNEAYHTNYIEEGNLLTTREQKFSQVAE